MNFKKLIFMALVAVLSLMPTTINAQSWSAKQAPIMTTWGETIDPNQTWQEYPRPQLIREDWQNLNGLWNFFIRTSREDLSYETSIAAFSQKILVPFAVESALSGIMSQDFATNANSTFMYRRTFTLPSTYQGKHLLLHFGAVDWKCKVYINGQEAGEHAGGNDPFSFDITNYLTNVAEQEIVVAVIDPTTNGGQPTGKQTIYPSGIWYTPVSGIWQTVWLEPVAEAHVERYEVLPDIDNQSIKLNVITSTANAVADIAINDGTGYKTVKQGIPVNAFQEISIPNPKRWSPDSPFIYDMEITLSYNGNVTDKVQGYFAMRKFSRGMANGHPCLMLNNEPLYLSGPLDQGYWPDGLFTAPSYEAMTFDLKAIKSLGMNMVRKHIKVEPDSWYTWCDRNGLIVWQDMPSGNMSGSLGPTSVQEQNFYDESVRIVNSLKQHPSIGAWIVFNEGWGQNADMGSGHTHRGVTAVRDADADHTRLINAVTGWTDFEIGDFLDIHSYPAPNAIPDPNNERISSCGEFGGITMLVEGHQWSGSQQVYTAVSNSDDYTSLFNQYTNKLQELQLSNGLWSSVYTQITDVEQELNGILTYDRKIWKITDAQKASIKKNIEQTIHNRFTGMTVALDAADTSTSNIYWRITTTQPVDGWQNTTFDDSQWRNSAAGFGGNERYRKTQWSSSDIWIRRHFTLQNVSTVEELSNLYLWMFHDEDAEVYINGVLAVKASGYNTDYQAFEMTNDAKQAILLNGDNVLAIHCHQTTGGQYIDAGFRLRGYQPNNTLTVTDMPVAQPLPSRSANDQQAYLMSYYTQPEQNLHYAFSYDGKQWTSLNAGKGVFNGNDPTLLMRDPYIRRVHQNGTDVFHLVHTWGMEHQGIYHWQSPDLIHWTAADGSNNGVIPLMNGSYGEPISDRAYSPEFTYDEANDLFYVYWSSMINNRYQIYYCTTKDWKIFSQPKLYFDPGCGASDLHISKMGNQYYAFFKDMDRGQNLCMATSSSLNPDVDQFKNTKRLFSNTYLDVNGPSTFPSLQNDGWFLYYSKMNGSGISYSGSSDPSQLKWYAYGDEEYKNPENVSQGSVEVISNNELKTLLDAYGYEQTDLLPTAETYPQEWKYTTNLEAGWQLQNFNDSNWKTGLTGFGANNPPNTIIKTPWKTSKIYLRKKLDLTGYSQKQIQDITARLYHDEDIEVYFNGILAVQMPGYTQKYIDTPVSPEAIAALRADNTNVISIVCSQTSGGQYVDFGLKTSKPIEISGIEVTSTKPGAVSNGYIYNLQGQIVRQTTKGFKGLSKGIYIVNGKKIVIP